MFLEILIFFFFLNDDDDDDPFFLKKQMRHGRMPLVCILMHDFFENLDIWGKDDFFFFKMDEAWPHAPSLEMDAWFLEVLNFFF